MKKISFFIIYSLLFIGLSFGYVSSVSAQESTSILISTTYSNKDDLDFLFENSTHVLQYLEGIELSQPLFLSVTSAEKLPELQKHNKPITIIDENADMSLYRLFFSSELNNSEPLKQYGEVYTVSDRHTLVKFPSQDSVVSHIEIENEIYYLTPLFDNLPTPPFRTATITLPPIPTSSDQQGLPSMPIDTGEGEEYTSREIVLIGAVLFTILLVASVGVYFIARRRNT